MTFKVGQRVRCVKSISVSSGGPVKGAIYTITAIRPNSTFENSQWIGFVLPTYEAGDISRGERANWGSNCFEPVKSRVKINTRRGKSV